MPHGSPDDPASNPNVENNPAEYSERDCPRCGETVKSLPQHLRHNCPDRPPLTTTD